MITIARKLAAFVLCLSVFSGAHAASSAVSVAPKETKSFMTVPDSQFIVVRSVVISNPQTPAACQQQVRRGSRVHASLCIQGGSSFQIEFSPALVYRENESIDLRNGSSFGTTIFTVNYRIVPPGKGLMEKEE